MSAVTFGDAAAHLGHKSRSTLYRLKRDGFLAGYLRPGGKGGAHLLELAPEGQPTLREWICGILQEQINSPTRKLPVLNAMPVGSVASAVIAQDLTPLVADVSDDQIPPLNVSRERRAHYQAELVRIETLERRGRLVDKEEILSSLQCVFRDARDQFLAFPSRLGPQIAGIADVREIIELLDAEVRHVLLHLANRAHIGYDD
jgi:DNA-binding transcriptional ArsR family regulator